MMRFELNWLSIVLIYWAVINIVTFFLYGIDKWKDFYYLCAKIDAN